ncbi:MAG: helix-hairpin-helix domain-containing protein [Saprospiraceae bacterium]
MAKNKTSENLLISIIREFSYFTKSERRGVFIIILLTVFIWTIPDLMPWIYPIDQQQMIIYVKNAEEVLNKIPEGRSYEVIDETSSLNSDKGDFQNENEVNAEGNFSSPAIQSFPFNPNTISVDSLQLLGFSKKTALTIEKYRSKGGRFFKKEDLKKIYGLEETVFDRLEGQILLEASKNENPEIKEKSKFSSREIPLASIDINEANAEDFRQIKGIGPFYSNIIIEYREKIGGFHSIEQMKEIKAIPDTVFIKMEPFLTKSSFKGENLEINNLDKKGLAEHPYISWRQAEALYKYRINHGTFTSIADIENVGVFNKEEINKLAPYLSFRT